MADKTISSFLEERKKDIFRQIELAVMESYMPNFCGVYVIYLNKDDGTVDRYVAQEDGIYDPDPSIHVLYRVYSHAGTKEDFIRWLAAAEIYVPINCSEKWLKQKYHKEYIQFWEENKQDGMNCIARLEDEFKIIKTIQQLHEVADRKEACRIVYY